MRNLVDARIIRVACQPEVVSPYARQTHAPDRSSVDRTPRGTRLSAVCSLGVCPLRAFSRGRNLSRAPTTMTAMTLFNAAEVEERGQIVEQRKNMPGNRRARRTRGTSLVRLQAFGRETASFIAPSSPRTMSGVTDTLQNKAPFGSHEKNESNVVFLHHARFVKKNYKKGFTVSN